MKATGHDHECGAPMVLDVAGQPARCAVCTAQDPTWTATTRPTPPSATFGLFHNLVLEIDALSYVGTNRERRVTDSDAR